MENRRMNTPPKLSGEFKPITRSSARRELDIFLLKVDRNMGKILAIVIVLSLMAPFVFAQPGDRAYVLMQWVLSYVR